MKRFATLIVTMALVLSGAAHAASVAPVSVIEGARIWTDYKTRFVKNDGRVIDNVNGDISHSEGQGYGMVLALAAGDKATFAKMYSFARTTLGVRDDSLFAWRYDPKKIPAVADKNNASDGDLLIAWALIEAANAGWDKQYGIEGAKILADLRLMIIENKQFGLVLLPGEFGFFTESGDLTINPAYWVYPALERLAVLTKDQIWADLAASGARLLGPMQTTFGGVVPDWLTLFGDVGGAGLSTTMSSNFGYEAIRVPLYVLWSTSVPKARASQIVDGAMGTTKARMQLIDLKTGIRSDAFVDPGYSAIAALKNCAVLGQKMPEKLKTQIDGNYYPATLQLLSLVAAQMRYPQCM